MHEYYLHVKPFLLLHLSADLGGSLAVASRGLFATGVSTDLSVTFLSSGGKVGDTIKAEVSCDKCTQRCLSWVHTDLLKLGNLWLTLPYGSQMHRTSL